jgi:hypothetical protein
MKSYFELYHKAKKLVDEKKVSIEEAKDSNGKDLYYFRVNGYTVRLLLERMGGNQWNRHWSCTCKQYSIHQEKTECKHVLASIYFLIKGGL